jgi:hypothetical protein
MSSHSQEPTPLLVTLLSPILFDGGAEQQSQRSNLGWCSHRNTLNIELTIHNLPDPSAVNLHRPYFIYKKPIIRTNDDDEDDETKWNGERRLYENTLCEMTLVGSSSRCSNSGVDDTNDLTTKYESFIVQSNSSGSQQQQQQKQQSYVVQDGTLYVVTPVDPLFWLLRDVDITGIPSSILSSEHHPVVHRSAVASSQQQQQWQPLSQFLHSYDPILVSCIPDEKQLEHLLMTMQLDDDHDTESYVLFSIDKAVRWLERKQQRMECTLWEMYNCSNENGQLADHSTWNGNNGAFALGFTIATTSVDIQQDQQQLSIPRSASDERPKQCENERQLFERKQHIRNESIQLVCNYLSPVWRQRFLDHLQVDPSILLLTPDRHGTNKRSKQNPTEDGTTHNASTITSAVSVDWNMSLISTNCDDTDPGQSKHEKQFPTKKLIVQPISAGAKRLLKVNQRGLQNISSFFGIQKGSK